MYFNEEKRVKCQKPVKPLCTGNGLSFLPAARCVLRAPTSQVSRAGALPAPDIPSACISRLQNLLLQVISPRAPGPCKGHLPPRQPHAGSHETFVSFGHFLNPRTENHQRLTSSWFGGHSELILVLTSSNFQIGKVSDFDIRHLESILSHGSSVRALQRQSFQNVPQKVRGHCGCCRPPAQPKPTGGRECLPRG